MVKRKEVANLLVILNAFCCILKILSSNPFPFTTNFTTDRQYQLAQSCSDLPQSVISEQTTRIPENLAKQGIPGQNKEKQNNDKNTFHLPRQDLAGMMKYL